MKMLTTRAIGAAGLFVLSAVGPGGSAVSPAVSLEAQQAVPSVTVYKSPACGCCSKWIDHMRAAGFEVTAKNVDDVVPIKTKHGVPTQAASCHTSLVGDYVIEGHVPADTVKRLLKERPKITGLAVPGMPAGSPGMEVPSGKKDPYSVIAFDSAGKQTVFEKR
jgi:hypothetical protein